MIKIIGSQLRLKRLLIFMLVCFPIYLLASKQVWVSSKGASLKSDKKASSATIENLDIGDELIVLSESGPWYKVQSPSGKKGYIYRGKIASEKPQYIPAKDSGNSGGSLGSLLGGLTGSNIKANSADTSRSIRGLSPDAETYAQNSGTPQKFRSALHLVLSMTLSDQEIDLFLKTGKIGEYAE